MSKSHTSLDRRKVLQGIAGASIVGMAGCAGEDNGEDEVDVDIDAAIERNEVDIDEIQDGGTLEVAIPRDSIDDYDAADSSAAEDTAVFSLVYDNVLTTDAEGTTEPWMAEEYEVVDSQDVDYQDYEEFMREEEIVEMDGGFPVFDLDDETNIVLLQHPDDLEDAEEGDEVRVLTRHEAADAVEGGVYGTRVSGTLFEGIEFHNGDELTAGDIVGSYDRYVGSTNQGQVFDAFMYADAPDGDDGYEFDLYSIEADAAAFVELPPIDIFPEEHHDIAPGELDPRDGGPVPVGTGPYEIDEFEEGSVLRLTRTDNYWVEDIGLENLPAFDGPADFPERPPIEEINVRFVPESAQRSAALQDGDLDLAYELASDARNNFADSDDFGVSAQESTGYKFMQFPLEDTEEGGAFSEPEIRRAVSALMPRQTIVDVVEQGWGSPARMPIPRPASEFGTQGTYDELLESDFAYSIEPEPDEAERLIEESSLEAPVEVTIQTNSDDDERIDKMQLVVDQLNQSGLFEAELETPAALGDWTTGHLYTEDAHVEDAENNACAVIGLATGFDPHGYIEAIHDPDNHNGCCNFYFPPGTFDDDFVDLLRGCRFGADVAEDADLRRQRYDEFWEEHTSVMANTLVDFSLTTVTFNAELVGVNAHPNTQSLLTYALYAPFDEQVAYLDR